MDTSQLDELYLKSWAQLIATPGLFRNPQYDATQRRPLGSETGAICQFNEEHLKNKRPTTMKTQDLRVVRDFDPAMFNFTKAKKEEIVVKVSLRSSDPDSQPKLVWAASQGDETKGDDDDADAHPFFANISPIMGAHGLFVPNMGACHPQVMTTERLSIALRVMALSARRDFRLGFNSLAAWASVNHCHFHVTYISDAFPADGAFAVERASVSRLAAVALPPAAPGDDTGDSDRVTLEVAALTGWPLGGFRFALVQQQRPAASAPARPAPHPRHVARLASAAGSVIAHMTSHEVAHNLLLADRGATVYVLPRAHQAGGGADEGRMAVAFAESCGIGIVYTQAVFDSFSQEEYIAALREYRIAGPTADALTAAAVVGVNAQGAAQ